MMKVNKVAVESTGLSENAITCTTAHTNPSSGSLLSSDLGVDPAETDTKGRQYRLATHEIRLSDLTRVDETFTGREREGGCQIEETVKFFFQKCCSNAAGKRIASKNQTRRFGSKSILQLENRFAHLGKASHALSTSDRPASEYLNLFFFAFFFFWFEDTSFFLLKSGSAGSRHFNVHHFYAGSASTIFSNGKS